MKSTRDIILQTGDLDAATASGESVMGLPVFLRSPAQKGFKADSFRFFAARSAFHGTYQAIARPS